MYNNYTYTVIITKILKIDFSYNGALHGFVLSVIRPSVEYENEIIMGS